jgi:hypothetical protein
MAGYRIVPIKRTCLGTALCLVLLPLQRRYDKQVNSWKRFATVLFTYLFITGHLQKGKGGGIINISNN